MYKGAGYATHTRSLQKSLLQAIVVVFWGIAWPAPLASASLM